MYRRVKNIHFVGIGGIGMSGIAEVLLNLGYKISGSDLEETDITERLKSLGARIFHGHKSTNLTAADVVVKSTAIGEDNPEIMEAHSRNIPVIPRAEMLAELLKLKYSIAVSGSHGKTTTTSMVSTVLAYGGLDPTMVIGGRLDSIGSNARLGEGGFIVAEADESDGSFLRLNPYIAVITNIDREHLDYYPGIGEIKDAFLQFANSVPFYGAVIMCGDCENVRDILPRVKRKAITYGIYKDVDFRAADISFNGLTSRYSLYHRDKLLGEVELQVPGLFNVYNSIATVAVALELGMKFSTIRDGIRTYKGVHRRLEIKGQTGGITVADDYGHHPTEIREVLAAAKNAWRSRLVVVFQPHRYTRTKALHDEFLNAFDDADVLILTDIYAASEKEIQGIHSMNLSKDIKDHGHDDVMYLSGFKEITDHLCTVTKPGDVVVTLGAGNVWKIGEDLLERLRSEESSEAGKE
ncbi:MAG TPA: UDP-N-acetylmuramate--L-alanine ligase [Syntrophales bacterium]|nr:UDP-N-acetylmuramate--L-alanine ligase [Syntrophales bacterium]HPQ43453.1 UDP-N-acetylmuramate--L-alanine ligase [Syntrophales bacterium]